MNTIMVVDDEKAVRYSFERMFEDDYKIMTAGNGGEALTIMDTEHNSIDVVFLDIRMPGMNGIEVLKKIKERKKNIPVIVMTAFSDSETAIEAMKEGAFDYLTKPFDDNNLRELIDRALTSARLQHEALCYCDEKHSEAVETIVGKSQAILKVCKVIGQAASSGVPVLITGESGVGKEIVARAIFSHSRRKDGPFMAVNCAAIPEGVVESELFGCEKGAFTGAERRRIGRFEQCNGGTIFLDEICDMSLSTQAKLLRVLQDGTFQRVGSNETIKADVRIIAASNKPLHEEVKSGRFREDLYHRLNVFPIHIMPLRERKEDIPVLAEYFLSRAVKETGKQVKGLSTDALNYLMSYNWHGNVRELENVIKRAVAISAGDVIGIDDIGLDSKPYKKELCALSDVIENIFESALAIDDHSGIYYRAISKVEKTLIEKALSVTKGNQVKASGLLGITRVTLRKKMHEYNIPS
ncbi:MAG: sigma-54-dependent Fis family transcriptional regulator [Nitrospirae bacterium]|nr:sigma-54-dependent Fis family transcriptional regulator [Nitrospirota bacterium]